MKQDSLKISICSLAFNLKVLMLESLWSGLICEGRGSGKGSGEERMEAPGSRPGEIFSIYFNIFPIFFQYLGKCGPRRRTLVRLGLR